MTKNIRDKSASYDGIGTDAASSDSVPILREGIGTRISDLAKSIGGRDEASDVMQVSAPTLQRYVSNKNMPPFDVAARLCLAAKVPMEWLATGIGDMHNNPWEPATGGHSQPLRRDDLKMALQLATEALGDKVLPPDKHSELVTLIYELLEEGLPEAKVLRFARAASA